MEFSLDFFVALRRMKAQREQVAHPASPLPTREGAKGWGSVGQPSVRDGAVPPPRPLPAGEGLSRRIGPAGLALIQRFEGCAKARSDGCFEAYPDPGTGGEAWTIGWGATAPGSRRARFGRNSNATTDWNKTSNASPVKWPAPSAIHRPARPSSMPWSAFTTIPARSRVPR